VFAGIDPLKRSCSQLISFFLPRLAKGETVERKSALKRSISVYLPAKRRIGTWRSTEAPSATSKIQ
jgi:hypothetical protein